MVQQRDPTRQAADLAATLSGVTSIEALIALIKSSGGNVNIPPELLEILRQMAQTQQDILTAVQNLPLNFQVQGYPPNANTLDSVTVQCQAANLAYRMPDMIIRNGFALSMEAPLTNTGNIFIARTPALCADLFHRRPLVPGQVVTGFVKTPANLYVMSPIVPPAGANVLILTVESDL